MAVPDSSNPVAQPKAFDLNRPSNPSEIVTGEVDYSAYGDEPSADEPSQISVTLKPSHRPNVLASVTVHLDTELGTITINDGRILKNKAGALWFALPTFSVTSGKQYEYFPSVELPSALLRKATDAALAAYERSAREGGTL
jgi:hypothetical protein